MEQAFPLNSWVGTGGRCCWTWGNWQLGKGVSPQKKALVRALLHSHFLRVGVGLWTGLQGRIRLAALRAWAPSFRKSYRLNVASSRDHSSPLQARFLGFGASEESDYPVIYWLYDLEQVPPPLKTCFPICKGRIRIPSHRVGGLIESMNAKCPALWLSLVNGSKFSDCFLMMTIPRARD